MIYVTRKAHFSAAHRLYNPTFSDERNDATFDKCNNPMGHGHNYTIECTVAGNPDPLTGYVIDLKKLASLMDELIIDKVDHKFFYITPYFRQHRKCFATSLVFEHLVRQFHSML